MATRMGLEPTTSAVTGRHSNQLNHRANVSVSDSYIYYHTFCVLARVFLNFRESFFSDEKGAFLQSRFVFEYHQKLHHSQTTPQGKQLLREFEYHQKLHHSQTKSELANNYAVFEYHQKLHHSQTQHIVVSSLYKFEYHQKLHHSQTTL